jgi:hypothetical protein
MTVATRSGLAQLRYWQVVTQVLAVVPAITHRRIVMVVACSKLGCGYRSCDVTQLLAVTPPITHRRRLRGIVTVTAGFKLVDRYRWRDVTRMSVVTWRIVTAATPYCGVTYLGALCIAYWLRSFSAQPPVARESRLRCATKVVVGSERRRLFFIRMIVAAQAHPCSLTIVTAVTWKVRVIGRARGPNDRFVLNEGDGLVSSEEAGCLHAAEWAREWLCEERV